MLNNAGLEWKSKYYFSTNTLEFENLQNSVCFTLKRDCQGLFEYDTLMIPFLGKLTSQF